MRKILIILLGLYSVLSMGETIDRVKAVETAGRFMSSRTEGKEIADITPISKNQHTTQYVVNFEPEGWVLIAADNRVRPILAYSHQGTFQYDQSEMSPEVNYWLTEYDLQVISVIEDNKLPKHKDWDVLERDGYIQLKAINSSVDPILKIKWDQGSGWNRFCPEDEDGPGGHAYVGCVAVAMAQSMYNVKLDAPLQGDHRYVHDDYGTIYMNYENEDPYDWEAMSLASSDDENARLLYHCAVAVSMDFGADGSGSYSSRIVGALKKYFGYSPDVTYYERFDDDTEWKELLKTELDRGNVLVYAGDPGTGEAGHCFNIDGYDINDYFHFNWGWSGQHNGYYSIENINPGSYKFNVNQDVIVGIAETYYGPTDITLSDLEVKEGLPVGSFVATVDIKDNSTIDLFTFKLDGGPKFPSGIKEAAFYIENDSLKTKYVFNATEKEEYLLNIEVTDLQFNTYSEEFIIKIKSAGSTSTPINEHLAEDVNVFYSYSTKSIVVKHESSYESMSFEMFDLNGRQVVNEPQIPDNSFIDVSHQNKGIYIVRLSVDGNALFRKVYVY